MEWPGWAVAAWEAVDPYVQKLAIWRGYEGELQTLLIYAVGIALYTALVFAFYQNLSRRDAFHFVKPAPGWFPRFLRFLESSFLFPLMSFLYFGVLALSLLLLAKTQSTAQILLLSMSVVVGVRVTAFVSENAALDLAKLLPLSLLGVLLVEPSYASVGNMLARLGELPGLVPLFGRYFVLFLVLEASLQAIRRIASGTQHEWARQKERRLKKKDLLKRVHADHAAGGTKTVTLTPMAPEPTPPGPREGPGAAEETSFERIA